MSEREKQRRLHRAQLAEARLRALQRTRTRYRFWIVALCAGFAGLSAVPLVAGGEPPGERLGLFTSLRAKSVSVDDLEVHGAIRIVDEHGRQLAVLGREGEDGPMVLGFFGSDGFEEQQTVRLAASGSGSAMTLAAPGEDTEMTLTAAKFGTDIQIRRGADTRTLSDERAPTPMLAVADPTAQPSAEVNLTNPAIQDIGHGLMVVKLLAVDRDGGLGISGRVINAASLRHTRLRFRVSVAGRSEEFGIVMISPGNSTGFAVTIPGVSTADARVAMIEYLGSTLSYAAHYEGPNSGEQKTTR